MLTGRVLPRRPGSSGSSENFEAARQLATAIGQGLEVLEGFGLNLSDQIATIRARAGDKSGIDALFFDQGGRQLQKVSAGNDPEALVAATLQALAGSGSGLPDIIATALQRSTATTTADLLSDVQFAAAISDLINPVNELERAMAELNSQFGDARDRAELLGLSVEEVNAALAKAESAVKEQFFGPLIAFQDALNVSDVAPGTPLDKFAEARRQFDELAGKALGGDLGAIQAIPTGAQALLQLGRQTFASGPQFQALFANITDLIDQLVGATGFQHGGSGIVGGSGGPDSRLFVARATPGEHFAFTPPGRRDETTRLLRDIGATMVEGNVQSHADLREVIQRLDAIEARQGRTEREVARLGDRLEKRVKAA